MRLAVHTLTGIPAEKGANLRVRTVSNLVAANSAFLRDASGLHRFFSKFAVSLSSNVVSAGFNSSGSTTQTTRVVTASVVGAVGAVTALWTQTGGDTMGIANPSGLSTGFSASVAPGETKSGTFKCTISDSSGHSADTDEVTAVIINNYGGLA